MRKWAVLIAAILLAVWLLMWFGATVMNRVHADDAERTWPLGLGRLADVRKRYPDAPTSASAYRLIELSKKMGIDMAPRGEERSVDVSASSNMQLRSTLANYVRTEIQKTTPDIAAPAPVIADYLAAHAGDLALIRALLLEGDEEVAWAVRYPGPRSPVPNLLGHMVLHRALLSNALDRARRGDHGAWEDARAVVVLSRGLWKRPELISGLIALAMDRSVNAAARKFPLPAPPWFAEFQKFDYTRAAMAARQAETSAISDAVYAETSVDDPLDQGHRRMINTLLSPLTRLATNDAIEADRRTAIEVAASRACDIDSRELTRRRRESLAWWNFPGRSFSQANLDAVWQRVLRFRAEREATERALRLRAGEPPLTKSDCSDGNWIYSGNGFRFSKQLATPQVPSSAIPVEFSLKSPAT